MSLLIVSSSVTSTFFCFATLVVFLSEEKVKENITNNGQLELWLFTLLATKTRYYFFDLPFQQL